MSTGPSMMDLDRAYLIAKIEADIEARFHQRCPAAAAHRAEVLTKWARLRQHLHVLNVSTDAKQLEIVTTEVPALVSYIAMHWAEAQSNFQKFLMFDTPPVVIRVAESEGE